MEGNYVQIKKSDDTIQTLSTNGEKDLQPTRIDPSTYYPSVPATSYQSKNIETGKFDEETGGSDIS